MEYSQPLLVVDKEAQPQQTQDPKEEEKNQDSPPDSQDHQEDDDPSEHENEPKNPLKPSRKFKDKRKKKKPKFLQNLAIDTDAINDEFDIGGEGGKKKDQSAEFAYQRDFTYELAAYTVQAMQKLSDNPAYTLEQAYDDDQEFLMEIYSRPKDLEKYNTTVGDKNVAPKPPAPKNAPQTVRGLKQIVINDKSKPKESQTIVGVP